MEYNKLIMMSPSNRYSKRDCHTKSRPLQLGLKYYGNFFGLTCCTFEHPLERVCLPIRLIDVDQRRLEAQNRVSRNGDGDLFLDLRCQFGGGRVHVFFL